MPPLMQQTLLDAVKQVGFPIVVAGVLLWMGNEQVRVTSERFDKQQQFITQTLSQQLEKSTTVIAAINETLKSLAVEQRETRAVMAELQTQREHGQ